MQTVLILGATSDMAVAIAKKFASKGYNLQLAAREVERLLPLQKDISIRYNAKCSLHEFEALNFREHHSFFEKLDPKPDVSICVFGLLGDNESARINWNEAEKIIHTNYTGAVSIINVISNYYSAGKKGIIVGISSVAGERGRQSNFFYGSAKAGFTAYLSGLRNRLFRDGVHVLTVQPGFVATRMTENLKLPELLTAQPEEVADDVYSAIMKKRDVIYVKWFWRWIMYIIKAIPEFVFKKLRL